MSWLGDRLALLAAPWTTLPDIRLDLIRHEAGLINLRRRVMATAQEFAARLDAATNEIASDLAGLRSDLEALRGSVDTASQAAVDAALAQLDGPIARLESLGADPADPVPAEPTPEPTPEQPA